MNGPLDSQSCSKGPGQREKGSMLGEGRVELGRTGKVFSVFCSERGPLVGPAVQQTQAEKGGKQERKRGGEQRRVEWRVRADGDGWRSRRALGPSAGGADAV